MIIEMIMIIEITKIIKIIIISLSRNIKLVEYSFI